MNDISIGSTDELVQRLAKVLIAKEALMVTAESCTGGGIAEALTRVPGSSQWFDCGFVTYSNEAKSHLLNIPDSLFDIVGPGAVSEEVALAMANGALANSRAELSVAVTGVAGPDGGSDEKPVGTVWIAWHWGETHFAKRFQFKGNRQEVRLATVTAALEGLVALVE